MTDSDSSTETAVSNLPRFIDRHRAYGWWALLAFLSLGVVLEGLHGLKLGFYLDPGHTLRRELWTLAHAHGTLFAIVNLVWASHLVALGERFTAKRLALTSHLLLDGSLLIPLGFFLGGAFASEHDPWSGVLLVPLGAVCLLLAVGMTALTTRS